MCVLVVQPCPTLCNPMDCILPGLSVLGIFQARILEWLLFPSPGDLSDPEIAPMSCISRQVLNHLNHQKNPKSVRWIIPDQPSTLLHLLHALGISCFWTSSVNGNQREGRKRARDMLIPFPVPAVQPVPPLKPAAAGGGPSPHQSLGFIKHSPVLGMVGPTVKISRYDFSHTRFTPL